MLKSLRLAPTCDLPLTTEPPSPSLSPSQSNQPVSSSYRLVIASPTNYPYTSLASPLSYHQTPQSHRVPWVAVTFPGQLALDRTTPLHRGFTIASELKSSSQSIPTPSQASLLLSIDIHFSPPSSYPQQSPLALARIQEFGSSVHIIASSHPLRQSFRLLPSSPPLLLLDICCLVHESYSGLRLAPPLAHPRSPPSFHLPLSVPTPDGR